VAHPLRFCSEADLGRVFLIEFFFNGSYQPMLELGGLRSRRALGDDGSLAKRILDDVEAATFLDEQFF
jgi:hypothetical protein